MKPGEFGPPEFHRHTDEDLERLAALSVQLAHAHPGRVVITSCPSTDQAKRMFDAAKRLHER
jgi:hypothetical protein